jgi:hypothetical protein
MTRKHLERLTEMPKKGYIRVTGKERVKQAFMFTGISVHIHSCFQGEDVSHS